MTDNNGKKVDVISAVKSPIGLLALVVLVAEVILGVLAAKADGTDFTILVIGMLVILGAVLLIVFKKSKSLHDSPGTEQVAIRHDLFLASPMASFDSDEEYKQEREEILALITTFRKSCKFNSVIYAGRDIEGMKDFDAPDISVKDDFEALKESRYFVMVMPRKLTSSVLVEAGAALAKGKPSIYFVKDRDDLPFLLGQAEMAFGFVKIYEYSTFSDITKLVTHHGNDLWPTGK